MLSSKSKMKEQLTGYIAHNYALSICKIRQDHKTLIYTFKKIFTFICQKLIFGGWIDIGHICRQFWDFSNISQFSIILDLKSFNNSWHNSYKEYIKSTVTVVANQTCTEAQQAFMKKIVNIKVAAIQLINHTNVGKKMFEFKS